MQPRARKEKGPQSAQLDQLSSMLLSLHKRLLDTARADYVASTGKSESAFRMLELVMSDPFFAWLRPVSQLIVEIDELASGPHDRTAVDAIVEATRKLLSSGDFGERYPEQLQRDAELVILHAQVQKALKNLEG
jgi:hypothetical protein